MSKKRIMLGASLLAVLGLVVAFALGQSKVSREDGQLQIVATFYPVYEFTKAVVGDEGQVDLLIGAGTEVHDFEPSSRDLGKIQEADSLVYLNPNMETWIDEVEDALDLDKVTLIKATGDMLLAPGQDEEHEHDHDEEDEHEHDHVHELDPHVWLAPNLALDLVAEIRDQLSQQFPDKAKIFAQNAEAYMAKLNDLDKEYRETLSVAKQKTFVTQHAAFGYLALEYGLTQLPITGLSAEADPSAKRLAELSTYVKDNGIDYIYFEENAKASLAKTLADEVGVKTAVLNPLESLTGEQMAAGEDYFSVMRTNLKSLQLTTDAAGKSVAPEIDQTKTVYKGYFEDKDIKDRSLADWDGDWQSIYPYLLDGSLDSVWDYKAKLSDSMSASDYKAYYSTGYATDVDTISIDGDKNTITFTQNGQSQTFTYRYVGYEVLTYKKGNRGVRYLYTTDDAKAGQFKNIQFSDHAIAPQEAEHFHLYWGDMPHDKLLEELDNWPTYYEAGLTGHEIAQEIVAH